MTAQSRLHLAAATTRSCLLLLAVVALAAIACAPRQQPTQPAPPAVLTWPVDLVLADSMEPKRLTHVFPTYPMEMQAEGREAKLVAVYVVDTSGVADLGTVRFLLDAPRSFATAICTVLRKARFEPLRRDGQLHPALVIDPFGFFVDPPHTNVDAEARWARVRPNTEALR